MKGTEGGGTAVFLSKAVSVALHPVLMPLYVLAVLMANGLLPSVASPGTRIYFFAVVILNTVAAPAAVCFFLSGKSGGDARARDFRERLLPMLVMIVCYTVCLFLIRDIPFMYPVRKMLIAGTGCLLAGFTATLFWRISLHMIAQGAVVGFMALLVMSGAENMFAALCISVAFASALASARLYLGKHDAAQIAAGFAAGVAITIISAYLF